MNNDIGAKLQNLRNEAKYTSLQVAKYLEITEDDLFRIENNEETLNATLMDKLCLLYNCSPEYVLGEIDNYEKPILDFRSDKEDNLEVIAKMNETMGFLKLLRRLTEE